MSVPSMWFCCQQEDSLGAGAAVPGCASLATGTGGSDPALVRPLQVLSLPESVRGPVGTTDAFMPVCSEAEGGAQPRTPEASRPAGLETEAGARPRTAEAYKPADLEVEAGIRPRAAGACGPASLEVPRAYTGGLGSSAWSKHIEALTIETTEPLSPAVPCNLTSTIRQVLSMHISDPTVLRATSLAAILEGLGRHFKAHDVASRTFTEEQAESLYGRSRQAENIDTFISHSWSDGRVGKLLTLCIWHNLRGGMAVSMATVAAAAVLTSLGFLPSMPVATLSGKEVRYAPWCLVSGLLAFIPGLLFWHHLPQLLLGARGGSFFFDLLCVHQFDHVRKEAGIRNFAAFIASSNQVLLLWTPAYFTRLWCTLEMAALVHDHMHSHSRGAFKPLPLVFMPLNLAKVATLTTLTLWSIQLLYAVNLLLGGPSAGWVFIVVVMVAVQPVAFSFMVAYARERIQLSQQLRSFSVEDSECLHERDRKKVFETLVAWFGDLEAFNEHVRTVVCTQILTALGRKVHIPAKMAVGLVLVNVFYEADFVAAGYYSMEVEELGILLNSLVIMCGLLTILPIQVRLACFAASLQRFGPCTVSLFMALPLVGYQAGIFLLVTKGLPLLQLWSQGLVLLLYAAWALWLQLGWARGR
mmetsp:Transcript_79239/g.224097  ORF Transcript_79239/g.224097 Transcript_79239/m.224097 type:complete len:641 (+) Transcript_79239:69-1991(+)